MAPDSNGAFLFMNTDKYIEAIKMSQKYTDFTSGSLDLSEYRYINKCEEKGPEIESGVYMKCDCLKCYTKWDDIGDVLPYSKATDKE